MPPVVTLNFLKDADESRDVQREVRDALIDRFGFSYRPSGWFIREVGAQHSAVVLVGPNYGERTNEARISLGVSRRDVNELWHELVDTGLPLWRATILNGPEPHFWGEPDPFFTYLLHTPEDVQDWMGEHIPRLVSEVCNFGFITAKFSEAVGSHPDDGQYFRLWYPRLVNAMLDGWTDEAEQEFIAPMIARLDEDWDSDPDKSIRQGRIDKIRAWIAENPGGIERECVD